MKNFNALSAPTKFLKRKLEEEFPPEPYRDQFERDRDRILYSKAFRRLSGKTQVFIPRQDDHLRTRLTHTLQVSQIARTIAGSLGFDQTLVEAIALGHDLGHTPFGHVGEETLNQILNSCEMVGDFQDAMKSEHKGFKHNYQGLRILAEKEQIYNHQGLNITNYTLWGILNHTKLRYKLCPYFERKAKKNCFLPRNPTTCPSKGTLDVGFYKQYLALATYEDHESWSFEGMIVSIADEIAQRQHDTEDALLMGVITRKYMLDWIESHFQKFCQQDDEHSKMLQAILSKSKKAKENKEFLTYLGKFIVELYVGEIILSSSKNLEKLQKDYDIQDKNRFEKYYLDIKYDQAKVGIQFDSEFSPADEKFHDFLKNRIINSAMVQQMDGRGRFLLRGLVKAYITNPRQLFDTTILWTYKDYDYKKYQRKSIEDKEAIGKLRDKIDLPGMRKDPIFNIVMLRSICDYISGMTDEFAIQQYHKLYS